MATMQSDRVLPNAGKVLMPGEIHADVNAGYSLVECLRGMEERRAKIGN